MIEIQQLWTKTTLTLVTTQNITASLTFQPITPLIGAASDKRGGNAMGLHGTDPPRIVLEITFMWTNAALDDQILNLSQSFEQLVQARAREQQGTTSYYPYYMNDANGDQSVLESYRDAAKFAALQRQMDPQGFFRRTESFKYRAS